MAQPMGNRLEPTLSLTNMLPRLTTSLFVGVFAMSCVSAHIAPLRHWTYVHVGSPSEFRGTSCYAAIDVRDEDDARVSLSRLRSQLRKVARDINPCDVYALRSLNIIYQAGRGVCIDCDLPKNQWSGFASITITEGGHEVAAVEWQGSGATDGLALLSQFTLDLAELLRSGRAVGEVRQNAETERHGEQHGAIYSQTDRLGIVGDTVSFCTVLQTAATTINAVTTRNVKANSGSLVLTTLSRHLRTATLLRGAGRCAVRTDSAKRVIGKADLGEKQMLSRSLSFTITPTRVNGHEV